MCQAIYINGEYLDSTDEVREALKSLGASGAVYVFHGIGGPSAPSEKDQCLCSFDAQRTAKEAADELGMKYSIRAMSFPGERSIRFRERKMRQVPA